MTLQEFFSASFSQVVRYLKDVARFILAPGDYIREVVQEADVETTRRLVFYALGFAILEVPAASVGVLAVAALEAAVGLLFAASFYLVSKYLRIPRPLKATLVYCLTFKFVYFTPLVILYWLFLVTEDYFFAMVRGYATYLQFFAYILIFPIALSTGLRRRVAATGLSVGVAVLIYVSVGRLGEGFETTVSRPERVSVLYDPIGAEVDGLRVDLTFMEAKNGELSRWADRVDSLLSAGHNSVSALTELPADARRDWTSIRGMIHPALEETRQSLKEQRAQVVFETSKRLLRLAAAEVNHGETLMDAADGFAASGSGLTYMRLERAKTAFLKAEAERLETLIEFLKVRNRLKSQGLLY